MPGRRLPCGRRVRCRPSFPCPPSAFLPPAFLRPLSRRVGLRGSDGCVGTFCFYRAATFCDAARLCRTLPGDAWRYHAACLFTAQRCHYACLRFDATVPRLRACRAPPASCLRTAFACHLARVLRLTACLPPYVGWTDCYRLCLRMAFLRAGAVFSLPARRHLRRLPCDGRVRDITVLARA